MFENSEFRAKILQNFMNYNISNKLKMRGHNE